MNNTTTFPHRVRYNNYLNDIEEPNIIENNVVTSIENNNNPHPDTNIVIDTEIYIPGSTDETYIQNNQTNQNTPNNTQNTPTPNDTNIDIELQNFNEECVICLDEINLGNKHIEYDTIVLKCNHAFHYHCYLQWIIDSYQVFYNKTKCPLCNQLVGNKSKYYPILRKKHHHIIENLGKVEDNLNNPFF